MQQLNHPGIVHFVDVFESERHFCIVMELMRGGNLFSKLVEQESFTEADVRRIIVQVNDAVNYCHGFGVLHRDIKLDNLLLANDQMGIDSVKLADFGLSKQRDYSLKECL